MTTVAGRRASQAAALAVAGAVAAALGAGLLAFDAIVNGLDFPYGPPFLLGTGAVLALAIGAAIVRPLPRAAQGLWVLAVAAMVVGNALAYALACILAVSAILLVGGARGPTRGERGAGEGPGARGGQGAARAPTRRLAVTLAWLGAAVGAAFYIPAVGVLLEYGISYAFFVTRGLETLGLALSFAAALAMARDRRWAPAAAIGAAVLLAALNWRQAIAAALLIAAGVTELRGRRAGSRR